MGQTKWEIEQPERKDEEKANKQMRHFDPEHSFADVVNGRSKITYWVLAEETGLN